MTTTYHGVEVTEHYRWLEDASSGPTVAWTGAQQQRTHAYFGGIGWRDKLRRRVEQLLKAEMTTYKALLYGGSTFFAVKVQTPRQQPFLVTLTDLDDLASELRRRLIERRRASEAHDGQNRMRVEDRHRRGSLDWVAGASVASGPIVRKVSFELKRGTLTSSTQTAVAGTPSLLRVINERTVLESVRRIGPVSRAQIARETALSKPTVSQALAGLLRAKLVREAGRSSGGKGPTAVLYAIADAVVDHYLEVATELQTDLEELVNGPPVSASFKADGTPTPAATGFAAKQGVEVSALERARTASASRRASWWMSTGSHCACADSTRSTARRCSTSSPTSDSSLPAVRRGSRRGRTS